MVIPTYNEEATIDNCIRHVQTVLPGCKIIVCDGYSSDDTVCIAKKCGVKVISCDRGRGGQLRFGASKANGDILVLLHCDSRLPDNVQSILNVFFSCPKNKVCLFRMNFDHKSPMLKFYSFFTRFESIFTSFGDQTIVVRKNFYDKLNGVTDICIMEDIDFLRRARKQSKIIKLNSYVTTSARRFQENGIMYQQLRNCVYVLMYLAGVSPDTIRRKYERSSK